jgi:branched-chain amino acid transport system substrate-binding protein
MAVGPGSWIVTPGWANAATGPIRLGIATDLTGGLGALGHPNANAARLAVQQINDGGGLLGRPVELLIEDTATNEATGVNVARKLVQRDKVDIVIGGLTSSMRNAIKDTVITRGRSLYVFPQMYEGQECTTNLFCTGPSPAQQCDVFVPWLMRQGAKRFALPGSDYVWPRTLGAYVRKSIEKNGGEIVYEEYFPLDQVEFGAAVSKIRSERVDTVFNMVIPPGVGPFFKRLYEVGYQKEGGRLACVYYDENAFNFSQPHEIEGLASSLDYFQAVGDQDVGSAKIQAAYDKMFPGSQYRFTAGNGSAGTYRAIMLWAAAVLEAKSTDRADVARALDHAKIAAGPGGPAEMVPGKRHARMNMYIAVAKSGKFQIAQKSPGLVEPHEC